MLGEMPVPTEIHVCQVCVTVMFDETGNQQVTSGLRKRQASQVTVLVEMLK